MIRAVLPTGHIIRTVGRRATEILVAISAGYNQRSTRTSTAAIRGICRSSRCGIRRPWVNGRRAAAAAARRRLQLRRRRMCWDSGTIQFDAGEESNVARVSIRDARQTGHDVLQALGGIGDGQI